MSARVYMQNAFSRLKIKGLQIGTRRFKKRSQVLEKFDPTPDSNIRPPASQLLSPGIETRVTAKPSEKYFPTFHCQFEYLLAESGRNKEKSCAETTIFRFRRNRKKAPSIAN